ncbi:MAG: TlpA disulfide reductase family protein [Spirochaetales bacterium]|nr:TlpA disulfide reductase family protein [Spirochaetales bacterium]
MISSTITLGPFNVPLILLLFAASAGAAHMEFLIIRKGDRKALGKASDFFFNALLLYVAGWRLSLIVTNWSTVQTAPTALLYLPGGLLNHAAGGILMLAVIVFLSKRGKYKREELINGGILSSSAVTLFVILVMIISNIPVQNTVSTGSADPGYAAEHREGGSETGDITLLTPEGEERLLDLRGAPVTIVNFWASWCPPCRAEIPEFIRFHEEYKESDIRLLTVNMTSTEKSLDQALDFIEKENLSFPVLLDHKGEAAGAFQINSIPTTIVFDSGGNIIKWKAGVVDYAWLRNAGKENL